MLPSPSDLWFLPLGGTGEIGMNFNLYGHDGAWLAVDCGITFADADAPRGTPHVQMPDPAWISANRDLLCGLVITHAHEDHIGAVAHLWLQLRCPVYATAFTAAVLRRKLSEAGLDGLVPLHVMAPEACHSIGPFDLTWVPLTHSIPEPSALVIRTSAGNLFHTADWKLDPEPVVGPAWSAARFHALGDLGIDAMVCDSTNALEPGWSVSEGALYPHLLELVAQAPNRVVVSCFASNLARLITLARIARATDRHACLFGRSLNTMVGVARQQGLWPEDLPVVPEQHSGYLPRDRILAIATGSQGEPGAALSRLARQQHRFLEVEAGDRVIFSSRVIPGNEPEVARLVARLEALEVSVIQDTDPQRPIHASGHPARDELKTLYDLIRPGIAVPTHGAPEHLDEHARLARVWGIPRVLSGRNGDLFMLAPVPGMRRAAIPTGRLGLDREGLLRQL